MFSFVVSALLFSFIVLMIMELVNAQEAPKIFGIYSQPTKFYPVKVVTFYLLILLRKFQKGSNSGDSSASGYGKKSKKKDEDMECPQTLSEHPKAIDAVYFNAADGNGSYLVGATARRPRGVINGFLYIKIEGVGLLEMPKMPDTLLFGESTCFKAEGLAFSCIEPMASWKLEYNGKMKLYGDDSKYFNVELDGIWTSTSAPFDFDTDMDMWTTARCIAKESWSKEYFENMEKMHQTHYEQMGILRASVTIDGKRYQLKLNSMRDHSYGHMREWKTIHRYGLHMFHTENGLSANVGIVCQPLSSSQFELGYLSTNTGEIIPVSEVDLKLWQHGERDQPPLDYAFNFYAGGEKYVVEVKIEESPEFYIGWQWEARIFERMATFRVNGVRGWGLAEWQYNHKGGRPRVYAQTDPQWTETLNKG